MGVNDGHDLVEPVVETSIKSVDWLRVFDRTSAYITSYHFNDDPTSERFNEVEYLTITPQWGASFNVHVSRCLIFKGIPVPQRINSTSDFWYWGMSVLQQIWDDLKNFGAGVNHINKLLYEFVIGKYKLKGLATLLAEGNEDKLRTRMSAINVSKSIINAVLLDSEEDFIRDSVSVTGIPDLLDRYMMFLAGVSGYPVTRLFGRSPAGQNATGESDLIN